MRYFIDTNTETQTQADTYTSKGKEGKKSRHKT